MNYDDQLDFCEYNPLSVQYEKEIKSLAKMVRKPKIFGFFEKLFKKIVLANGAEA